ncbi:hypothetical protein [Neobacillus drentensis]
MIHSVTHSKGTLQQQLATHLDGILPVNAEDYCERYFFMSKDH